MDTSSWNFWSAIMVQSTASFTQFLLCIVYIYSSIRIYSQNRMEDLSMKTELLHIVTLLILFVQTTNWLFNYSGLYTKYLNIDCKYVFGSCYLLYLYYNGFLYCVYLQRLLFVYNNTSFELHRTIKIILWLLIIAYFIAYTVIVYVEIFVNNIVQTIQFTRSRSICWGMPSSVYIFIGFVLMSFIFSIITLILFIKPLYKLFSETSIDNKDLLQLSSKYSILTFLTIISTTCAGIGHTVLELPFVAGISVLINSVFIVLYEKRFATYYVCMCSTMVKKVDQILISKNLTDKSISKIPKMNEVKSYSTANDNNYKNENKVQKNEMVNTKSTTKNKKITKQPPLPVNLSISLIEEEEIPI
eukprot:505562_1